MLTAFIILAVLLLALFCYVLALSQKKNKKSSELKSELDRLESEQKRVESELKELEKRSTEIDSQTAEVRELAYQSLRSAKRIQTAAFTQKKEMLSIFPNSFIFTKAKNIVSGDFYKAVEIANYKVFALADCSGFGVPGGFLSMLGIAILKEQLSFHYNDENLDLTEIMSAMRDAVISGMHSDSDSQAVNDEFNLTLVAFHKFAPKIIFAGANQNLYIARDGNILTFPGDKQSIGWSPKGNLPYNQETFEVDTYDMVYFTTDSLQGQFGGPKNQKFSTKRLVQMFADMSTHTIDEQYSIVDNTVSEWINGYKMVDDLTVCGIRV